LVRAVVALIGELGSDRIAIEAIATLAGVGMQMIYAKGAFLR
jgi:hypothetical protein